MKSIFLGTAIVILLGSTGYLSWQYRILTQQVTTLAAEGNRSASEQAQATRTIQNERIVASTTIADLENKLTLNTEQLLETERELRREEDKNKEFESQIKELASTVGVLDKLAKTDKELLQKYSKVYFLNENYTPKRLKQIDQTYVLAGKKDQYFHASAIPFLLDMIDDAKEDGIDLKVISAYRSFDEQNDLKGQYTQVYGSGANTFSADQGFSEHQLGTTLDITDPVTAGPYTSFDTTKAFAWLNENAHKYGFILSYPKGNTFYVYEPWHWRFVGVDLARDLRKADAHFYDWDQRKIDEYLVSIFD